MLRGPPLPAGLDLPWQQALLDVLFEEPIESRRVAFAIRPRSQRLGMRVVNAVRFFGAERRGARVSDRGRRRRRRARSALAPGAASDLRARASSTSSTAPTTCCSCCASSCRSGARLRALVWIVTAFTVGHSVTLIASAYGSVPRGALVPAAGRDADRRCRSSTWRSRTSLRPNLRRRWLVAFAFGLVHGFGFSFALRNTLQFAGAHLLMSLLAFNVGIELGQLLVLVLLVPALNVAVPLRRAERIGGIVLVGARRPHGVALARGPFTALAAFVGGLPWVD